MEQGNAIKRLVGVYNAEGTLRGEISYWVGARLGRRHCALCDITHGSVREKAEWKICRSVLPVQFDMFHSDDQPEDVRALLGEHLPAVVAETGDGLVLLLGPTELEACGGDPHRLVDEISNASAKLGLRWSV